MAFTVQMPALGESVTEGTVTRWLKQEGDTVEVDEPLLEVSTDKVDTEIPSPAAGVLQRIVAAEDETVEVGGELAVIGDEADGDGGGGDAASDEGGDETAASDEGEAETAASDEGEDEGAASDDGGGDTATDDAAEAPAEDEAGAEPGGGRKRPRSTRTRPPSPPRTRDRTRRPTREHRTPGRAHRTPGSRAVRAAASRSPCPSWARA